MSRKIKLGEEVTYDRLEIDNIYYYCYPEKAPVKVKITKIIKVEPADRLIIGEELPGKIPMIVGVGPTAFLGWKHKFYSIYSKEHDDAMRVGFSRATGHSGARGPANIISDFLAGPRPKSKKKGGARRRITKRSRRTRNKKY